MISEAIRLKLLDITNLTDWLATYKTLPAIFCLEVAPPDCATPLCVIYGEGGLANGRQIYTYEATVNVDIAIWQEKSLTTKTMREIAMEIVSTLDGQEVICDGWRSNSGLTANFPEELTDPDGFQGVRIPLTVDMEVCRNV